MSQRTVFLIELPHPSICLSQRSICTVECFPVQSDTVLCDIQRNLQKYFCDAKNRVKKHMNKEQNLTMEDGAYWIGNLMRERLNDLVLPPGKRFESRVCFIKHIEAFCASKAPGGFIPIFLTRHAGRYIFADTTLNEVAKKAWTLGPVRKGKTCVLRGTARPDFDKKHFSPRVI